MPFPVVGIFGSTIIVYPIKAIVAGLHFKIEPANAPGTMYGCLLCMLWLHVVCHPAAAFEVFPLRQALCNFITLIAPGETIWARWAFYMQWRG